jgi:hypothetical protein
MSFEVDNGGLSGSNGTIPGAQDALAVPRSLQAYGAKCDAVSGGDAAMSSSVNPTQLTSASHTFTTSDIGKYVSVAGAGAAGAPLSSTIASIVSAHVVALANAASTTVSGAVFYYGTDDTAALTAAIAANQVSADSGTVSTLFVDGFCITGPQTIAGQIAIKGFGPAASRLLLKAGATAPLLTIQTTGANYVAGGYPYGRILIQDLRLSSLGGKADPAGLTLAHGISLATGTWSSTTDLDGIQIYGMPGDGIHSASYNGSVNSFASHYWNNGGNGWSSNSDLDWTSTSDEIALNSLDGVLLTGSSHFEFVSPNIFSNTKSGLHIFGVSNDINLYGGSIDHNVNNGILLATFTGTPFRLIGVSLGTNNNTSTGFSDILFDATSTGSGAAIGTTFASNYASANGAFNVNFVSGTTSTLKVDGTSYFATGSPKIAAATNDPTLIYVPPIVLGASGAFVSTTADGVEHNLAAVKVPANAMGTGGYIKVLTQWALTSSANVKTQTIRISATKGDTSGGTAVFTGSPTTSNVAKYQTDIFNSGATNAQWVILTPASFGASSAGAQGAVIDTTADWYININGKSVNGGGDTNQLRGYEVTLVQ